MASDLPWEELHGRLHAFIRRRVRNGADVDDLVQRVLLRIVQGVSSLRDSERLHAWIYRTARNVIVDHYRSAIWRREVAGGSTADLEGTVDGQDALGGEDEVAALRELAACLAPMIARLPAEYRDAVTQTDLYGVSQVEAARRAGLSVSGMKSRVQRGRRQLRAILEECCRVDLDRHGAIVGFEPRHPASCTCHGCGGKS